jgi:hypothetical protein
MSKRKLLKAYPFLEEVDSFSLGVALAIYKIRPHWLNMGKVGEYKGNKFLSIEMQSPRHDDWNIHLTTDIEVTVAYYHTFHVHFSRGRRTLETALREAFEFIDDLVREKWLVGFIFNASGRPQGHAYAIENIPNMKPDEVHYIRSWLGTYDKNLLEE